MYCQLLVKKWRFFNLKKSRNFTLHDYSGLHNYYFWWNFHHARLFHPARLFGTTKYRKKFELPTQPFSLFWDFKNHQPHHTFWHSPQTIPFQYQCHGVFPNNTHVTLAIAFLDSSNIYRNAISLYNLGKLSLTIDDLRPLPKIFWPQLPGWLRWPVSFLHGGKLQFCIVAF